MKRKVIGILAFMLLITAISFPSSSMAIVPDTAPLVEKSSTLDGMIRVWLSSIRSNTTYNLTVSGTYTLNGSQLSTGTKVKVEFSGGNVYITANGNRMSMGSSAILKRESGGVKISESLASGNLYPGDMRFLYSNGTAYVVCYLYIEDYVYGVLPYEMDNSFPLEALKAQAVAARTYGMRAKTTSGVYDVTDTTSHQVFRGVNYGKARCIQAVDESWNVVMQYNGGYAGAYYSASNGGQTEASNHVWGGSPINYLVIKDDPFDLANTRTVKKSYLIYSSPQGGNSVSAFTMIRNALASKLGGSADSYTITGIDDIQLHSPMYTAPSRLYTQMRVNVRYNSGNSATLDIPIFPTAESMLGLNINSMNNELYTVEKETSGFRVTARRFGHGAGMSQRGAEQMGEMGYSYGQIIGFYYPGVQRVRMNFTTNWTSASPTPAPVNDATGIMEEKQATVVLTNPTDHLNLRREASETSSVLEKIPNGATVIVINDAGDWYKVRYGSLTGYVVKRYLSLQTTPMPTQTPMPSAGTSETAIVRLNSGSLNLRFGAGTTTPIIGGIPNGEPVFVIEKGQTWTRVQYKNQVGYVLTSYLSFPASTQTAPPASSQRKAYINLANTGETLNLRFSPSITEPIIALLKHGTEVIVEEKGAEWSKVTTMGMTGYVMNRYVVFDNANNEGNVTPMPTATPLYTPPPTQQVTDAIVNLSSGTLNMRIQPNAIADVIVRIPNGATVQVTQVGDQWNEVKYQGLIGYVMNRYLLLPTSNAGSIQPSPSSTAQTTTSQAWVVTKNGDRVNLRRSASSTATILANVPSGAKVIVLETGYSWSLINYQGIIGYMATQYLSGQEQSIAVATPTAPPQGNTSTSVVMGSAWIISRNGDSVHLRKAASQTADSIALMPYGAEITLLQVGEMWCKVIYHGLTGYVMGDYLTFVVPAVQQATVYVDANQTAAPSQSTSASEAIVAGNKKTSLNSGKVTLNSPTATLHLLSEPDALSTWTGNLSQGQTVEILQYYDRNSVCWLYLRSDSIEGYALLESIRLENRIAQVNLNDPGTTLAVRTTADGNAEPITSLSHGTFVTVIGSETEWALVRLEDGKTGYVHESYIRYL